MGVFERVLTNRCRRLRRLLTSYVDDEITGADRLVVEEHLKRCRACRRRLLRHRAVHQLLRSRSAETRHRGAVLPWTPRAQPATGRAQRRVLLSLAAVLVLVVGGIALWGPIWPVMLTAQGRISDSMCRGNHAHPGTGMMTMSERDCVGRCIEKGGRYVFVSDGVVYRIRNQSFSDLARFAAQDIQLEGRLWRDQLTVSHIESIDHVADARSGLARRRQNLSVAKELISRRAEGRSPASAVSGHTGRDVSTHHE